MILHYIPKDNLRQHWDYVKHGLELVRERGHTSWIVDWAKRKMEFEKKLEKLASQYPGKKVSNKNRTNSGSSVNFIEIIRK